MRITIKLKDIFTATIKKYVFNDTCSTLTIKQYSKLLPDNFRIKQAIKQASKKMNGTFEYVSHVVAIWN